jgi:hypothetical protein
MRAAIVNDFDTADCSDTLEEFLKIVFRHIVRKISYVNTTVFDGGRISTTAAVVIALTSDTTLFITARLLFLAAGIFVPGIVMLGFVFGIPTRAFGTYVASLLAAWFTGLFRLFSIRATLWAWRTDRLLVESDGLEEFLEPSQLDGCRHRPALRFPGSRALTASFTVSLALSAAWLAAVGTATFGVATIGNTVF